MKQRDDLPYNIEMVAPGILENYAGNAKRHAAEQVDKIASSIQEFGFNAPVLVDGDNGIIAGHGRVAAAIQLGLSSVPCIRLKHLTESQKRAYVLADNRLSEIGGGWDEEKLAKELEQLQADGFDRFDEILGFDPLKVDALLNGIPVDDPISMMEGLGNTPKATRTIHCHFRDNEAVEGFARLLGQTITDKTKSIWYPRLEPEDGQL